jgi:glycosyltransferase involved in cell wall biosynthesis
MKILWICNIPLPEASELLNERPIPFGGWLVNASEVLSKFKHIELAFAFPKNGLCNVKTLHGKKTKYYAFPPVNESDSIINNNKYLEKIIDDSKPDIVHIFGTEFSHTLAMVNICRNKNINTIISIQGLVSVISKHYMASLPQKVQNRFTFRDFIKQDNLKQQQKKFAKRGVFEIESLQKVNHIIGRTTWDNACTSQINPNAYYHHCNEILRDEFYKHTWNLNRCEKHSIFISQGSYPIKGLHFMLEAMTLILKQFPDTKLYIGGQNITKSDSLKEKLKLSSYGKYIKELIQRFDLENKVIFTGILDEQQMCERHLISHVFVCPSSIENSPNSLGEAMLLGVPCVASDVGGVVDMLKHKDEGFVYPADAPYMLAHYICEIFSDDSLAKKISSNAKSRAMITHNRDVNSNRLKEIYKNIINNRI